MEGEPAAELLAAKFEPVSVAVEELPVVAPAEEGGGAPLVVVLLLLPLLEFVPKRLLPAVLLMFVSV